jgi:hypothetical protein
VLSSKTSLKKQDKVKQNNPLEETMLTLLLTILIACGDKDQEDTAQATDTASESTDTAQESEDTAEGEDTSEIEDTASEE